MILDRDGVINLERDGRVLSPDAWTPIPGSLEAIASLHLAGIQVAIATNQSQVGRGLITEAELAAIHRKLLEQVAEKGGRIASIRHCPHRPEAGCDCRKPKPGLLFQISRELRLPLREVPFVGDSRRDLEAALAAGCKPLLVRTGHGASTERHWRHLAAACFDDLAGAAEYLVKHPG